MNSAQPFVVIHDDNEPMYRDMYFIACAYSNAGTLIETHGEKINEFAYIFPAVVCQAFAIELFLKFFYYLDHPEIRGKQDFTKHTKPGNHHNSTLWDKIQPSYRQKVALQAKVNEQQFRQELIDIGDDPFVKWRYVHEQHGIDLLPVGAIKLIAGSLGHTANEVMNPICHSAKPVIGQPVHNQRVQILMLDKDSILRRVPAAINSNQALFIDGIRHAVEIIDLAYGRLRDTLTSVALNPPSSSDLPYISSQAFLDAWAMVDAIDRFRMLYLQMPGITFSPPELGVVTLDEALKPFRDLRNVADHLAQRADFVVSRGGSALGTLSWLTGFKVGPITAWYCTLRPGTVRAQPEFRKEPFVSTLDWPTDGITLVAGGYEGNLSSVRSHIELRIKHFEEQLKNAFNNLDLTDSPTASDVFTRQAYTPDLSQFKNE